jgi:hypothetical protein
MCLENIYKQIKPKNNNIILVDLNNPEHYLGLVLQITI